jgi:peptidoglycan-N-acetylglucosamine deacetylase
MGSAASSGRDGVIPGARASRVPLFCVPLKRLSASENEDARCGRVLATLHPFAACGTRALHFEPRSVRDRLKPDHPKPVADPLISFTVRGLMFRRFILISSWVLPLLLLVGWAWLPFGLRVEGVIAMLAIHVLYLAGTLRPNTGWFHPAVLRFATQQKEVWLTFDDGPDPTLTPQVLALLKQHEAQATFFLIGQRAAAAPELVSQIAAAGHQLANHTFTHPAGRFWCLPSRAVRREVARCNQALQDITGALPSLFRAPVGMVSPSLSPALQSEALTLIGWSARGFDARSGSPEGIMRRVLRDLCPGSIILLHPERRAESLAALDLLLSELSRQGYRCVIPDATQFLTS